MKSNGVKGTTLSLLLEPGETAPGSRHDFRDRLNISIDGRRVFPDILEPVNTLLDDPRLHFEHHRCGGAVKVSRSLSSLHCIGCSLSLPIPPGAVTVSHLPDYRGHASRIRN